LAGKATGFDVVVLTEESAGADFNIDAVITPEVGVEVGGVATDAGGGATVAGGERGTTVGTRGGCNGKFFVGTVLLVGCVGGGGLLRVDGGGVIGGLGCSVELVSKTDIVLDLGRVIGWGCVATT
jgi:hypothetical protein